MNLNDGYEARFIQKHTCLIEPIKNSGFSEGGVYVLDYDYADTTMMVRVIETHDCDVAQVGSVYLVPVYSWDNGTARGIQFRLLHENNLLCEIEGYDEAAALIEQEVEDAVHLYPVCAKG